MQKSLEYTQNSGNNWLFKNWRANRNPKKKKISALFGLEQGRILE